LYISDVVSIIITVVWVAEVVVVDGVVGRRNQVDTPIAVLLLEPHK